jgi:hypothetical protein
MKRLIVGSIEALSTIVILLMLLGGLIGGMEQGHYAGNALLGAVVGLAMAFAAAVLVFGVLFILLEMNENLRAIRAALERQAVLPPRA